MSYKTVGSLDHKYIKTILIFIFIFGAIIVLIQNGLSTINAAQADHFISPTDSVFDPDNSLINILSNLAANSSNDEIKDFYNKKLEVVGRSSTQRAEARSKIAPRAPNTITPYPIIVGKRQTGILDNASVPFPSSVYHIENEWQEKIRDTYNLVYAGALAGEPQQGIVIVDAYVKPKITSYRAIASKKD